MPLGKYKNFDACVSAQMKKGLSKDKASSYCGAIKKKVESNNTIRYSVDIHTESMDDGIKISGVAIEATTSRNGITYEAEELNRAAKTLKNKPIGLNHNSKVEDIVGKVVSTESINGGKQIQYEGIIKNTEKNKGIVEMIKEGLIQNVSIEAMFESLEKKGNKYIAKGIEFLGLDLVKTPGVAGASVSLAESFESLIQNNLFNNTTQMNVFKKFMTSLEKREYVSKEDKNLLNSMFESLDDEQKEEVQEGVNAINAKPEEAKPADGNVQVEKLQKTIGSLSKRLEKAEEANATLRAAQRTEKIQKIAEGFYLSNENSVGIKKTDENKKSLEAFLLSLSEEQADNFAKIMESVVSVELGERGSEQAEAQLNEDAEEKKARSLAKDIAKEKGIEFHDALSEAYEELGLV